MPNNYTFDGTEGSYISKATADQYKQNYDQSPAHTWNQGIKAHFLGRDIIEDILSQNDCKGIRVYYGAHLGANNKVTPQLVFVGADSSGKDIETNGKIADETEPCPPYCD